MDFMSATSSNWGHEDTWQQHREGRQSCCCVVGTDKLVELNSLSRAEGFIAQAVSQGSPAHKQNRCSGLGACSVGHGYGPLCCEKARHCSRTGSGALLSNDSDLESPQPPTLTIGQALELIVKFLRLWGCGMEYRREGHEFWVLGQNAAI